MAMAAVRIAARRLTGQQSQAILRSAVEGEQGLLNRGGAYARRFTSSEACTANGPKISTEGIKPGDSLLRAADQMKEELCDILHEIQMNKNIPRVRRMKDRWLLLRLTEHVAPRPSNPEWGSYVRENAITHWVSGAITFFAVLYVVEKLDFVDAGNEQVQGEDSNREVSSSCAEQSIGK